MYFTVTMRRSIKISYLSTRSLLLHATVIVHLLSVCMVGAVRAPPPIEINKCCRNGEQLDGNQLCSIGSTEQFWPPVYQINKQNYYSPRGSAPRFMRVRERRRPDCEHPELFQNGIALFSNGSLFLGERNAFIDLNNYCVDKDAALVCLSRPTDADSLHAPIKLTKIRKCCGQHSVYFTSAETCVPENTEHGVKPEQFIDSSQNATIDLVYGFPSCGPAASNRYLIAGQYRKEHLDVDNGSYHLDAQKVLKVDEFCIDHTIQNADAVTVTSVFACADLVAVKERPEQKTEQVCCLFLQHCFYLCLLVCHSQSFSRTLYINFSFPSFVAEQTLLYLFDCTDNFGSISAADIGHWIPIAVESSCAALSLSNLLRWMFANW